MEDWGEEIFQGGVGIKWEKWAGGEGEGKLPHPHPHPHLTSAPILYRPSIPDGSIANPIYCLAFRSKMTPALQAIRGTNFNTTYHLLLYNFRLNTPKGSVKAPAVDLLRLNTLWSRYQNCFLITSEMYHEQSHPFFFEVRTWDPTRLWYTDEIKRRLKEIIPQAAQDLSMNHTSNTIVLFYCVKPIVLLCKEWRSLLCSLWRSSTLAIDLVYHTPAEVSV